MTCNRCETNSIVFDVSCSHCRTRLALSEPCKIIRKMVVDSMEKYGETEGWKSEPHCGCEKLCIRLNNVQKQEVIREDERTSLRKLRRR
jgi:hypothetical protein